MATFAAAAAYAHGCARHWLATLALLAGLGLANHWPLHLLSLPAPLLWLLQDSKQLQSDLRSPRLTAACTALFICGLTPYIKRRII